MSAIARTVAILVVLFIFWFWYMIHSYPSLNSINLENITFKTGDIILFHAFNNTNAIFTGAYWGHIGIVYVYPEIPDMPFIFEANGMNDIPNYDESNKNGIIITDLYSRIEKYPGLIAYKALDKPIDPDIIRGFTELMIYAKENMYYNYNVFRNAIEKKIGGDFHHGTNCGELVYLSLIKLKLLPKEYFDSKLLHHLLYVTHVTDLQNNFYREPLIVNINPF